MSEAKPFTYLIVLTIVSVQWLSAYNLSPSTTAFNQIIAIFSIGLIALLGTIDFSSNRCSNSSRFKILHYLVVACLLGIGAITYLLGSSGYRDSLAAGHFVIYVAAMVAIIAGHVVAIRIDYLRYFTLLVDACIITGLLTSVVAIIQVFAPGYTDGVWIASSSVEGRASGNLRQPNHLSSLMLWALIALVCRSELQRLDPSSTSQTARAPARERCHPLPAVMTWACAALFTWVIVLSASRTGMVGIALLALWGIADRRLSSQSRLLLLSSPLVYAATWWGMAWWAQASEHAFGGQQRFAESDLSGSRFRIWADALQLIAAHPWTGVGWGNFNFAWSLTPFPNRHTAFFDHTHNLPLQLAVELGLPMAVLICGVLLWALRKAWYRSLAAEPTASAAGRCAVMMIVLIGLHSLLEYPLWYAYFLLPTAFVWGFALGLPPATAHPSVSPPTTFGISTAASATTQPPGLSGRLWRDWPLAVAGVLCMTGAVFAVFDYLRVADIFAARSGAAPLEQRIEAGKHSTFFAHHAHYAAATVSDTPGQEMASFDIASHHLLDTRLMMAWAKAFAEIGDLDRARHLAERLREFRNPASADFFAECDRAREAGMPVAQWPFQCQGPSKALTWQDFLAENRARTAAR